MDYPTCQAVISIFPFIITDTHMIRSSMLIKLNRKCTFVFEGIHLSVQAGGTCFRCSVGPFSDEKVAIRRFIVRGSHPHDLSAGALIIIIDANTETDCLSGLWIANHRQ